MAFTSVKVKIPTLVIISGSCAVIVGKKWEFVEEYNVIPASAGRIQAYVTFTETAITMLFPTEAKTVAEAEAEFTDEAEDLLSRRS